MDKICEILDESLNIDFIAATISNPREKSGAKKVKVRPVLKKDKLLFQCEEYRNNQVFHENCEAVRTREKILEYMEHFGQMQLETKQFRATVLVSKKGKVTIRKFDSFIFQKNLTGLTKPAFFVSNFLFYFIVLYSIIL